MTTGFVRFALALLAITVSAGAVSAQDMSDRLEFHGSLNTGYGRAYRLPILGVPTKGTSDYRVFTLQTRFSLDEKNQIVTQIFNRRFGASPLAGAIADVTMQWAYWQHRAGDLTVKAGRNPLPRGLFNEVRYIGTVLPFFRPPFELQQDAFDAVDGVIASYRAGLPLGLEVEQHVFAGGSENRSVVTTPTGMQIRVGRTENMYGMQSYFTAPVLGLRFGAYGAKYHLVQGTTRGPRTNTIFSAETTPIERVKLVTEHGRITGRHPFNDNRSGYGQASVRVVGGLSVAGQYAYTNRYLNFANDSLNWALPEVRTSGASLLYRLQSNTVVKLEHHWRRGWSFDAPTPPVEAQTATSVTYSPARKASYWLASVAASF